VDISQQVQEKAPKHPSPFSVTFIGRNGLAPLRTGRSLPGDKIPQQADLFSLPHPIRDQGLKRPAGNR